MTSASALRTTRGLLLALSVVLTVSQAGCSSTVEEAVATACESGSADLCDGATKVIRCLSDGRGYEVIKVCSVKEVCQAGKCKLQTDSPYGQDAGTGTDASADAGPDAADVPATTEDTPSGDSAD